MLKNFFLSWLYGVSNSLCHSEDMVRSEPSFEQVLVFLKDLLSQPLSEETKDSLNRNIVSLSLIYDGLREENQRLKAELRSKRHVSFSPSTISRGLSPQTLTSPLCSSGGSGRMVDLLRPAYRRPELVTPPRTGLKKPEPLRARNSREPPREVKFTKYPPLPAIKTKPRPRLLRERTYDVINPIYVKGPPEDKEVKSKPLEKKTAVGKQEVPAPLGRGVRPTSRPTSQLPTPRRLKPQPPQRPEFIKRVREPFDPSALAPPTDIPSNVFWFPV